MVPNSGGIASISFVGHYFSSHSKIGHLDDTFRYQEVVLFQISMKISNLVHILYNCKNLEHLITHHGFGEGLVPMCHKLSQICVHVFKYEEKLTILIDEMLNFHNVSMVL